MIGRQRASPSRQGQRLGADAVHGHHEGAVGDALAHDHLLPQRLGIERRMVGLGADGGGVDEDLGAGQRVGPAQLGEPLVPAGGEAEGGLVDGDRREAAVAGAGSSGPRSTRR